MHNVDDFYNLVQKNFKLKKHLSSTLKCLLTYIDPISEVCETTPAIFDLLAKQLSKNIETIKSHMRQLHDKEIIFIVEMNEKEVIFYLCRSWS